MEFFIVVTGLVIVAAIGLFLLAHYNKLGTALDTKLNAAVASIKAEIAKLK